MTYLAWGIFCVCQPLFDYNPAAERQRKLVYGDEAIRGPIPIPMMSQRSSQVCHRNFDFPRALPSSTPHAAAVQPTRIDKETQLYTGSREVPWNWCPGSIALDMAHPPSLAKHRPEIRWLGSIQ